jgi:hypothetical protein
MICFRAYFTAQSAAAESDAKDVSSRGARANLRHWQVVCRSRGASISPQAGRLSEELDIGRTLPELVVMGISGAERTTIQQCAESSDGGAGRSITGGPFSPQWTRLCILARPVVLASRIRRFSSQSIPTCAKRSAFRCLAGACGSGAALRRLAARLQDTPDVVVSRSAISAGSISEARGKPTWCLRRSCLAAIIGDVCGLLRAQSTWLSTPRVESCARVAEAVPSGPPTRGRALIRLRLKALGRIGDPRAIEAVARHSSRHARTSEISGCLSGIPSVNSACHPPCDTKARRLLVAAHEVTVRLAR